ncbi:phosphate ABC transporter substrate-binding protein PstS [Cellulomonas edaphi]|uniref:Phosphate ABC transporter substrate-binding protein PstS n=1 Tax=Cellulomonas edaphi TaxID=3053468 RepID=A0ABT7S6F5_9CELL|nr:phosphate ABC transporter substrate-binding protein PstS [Cellulomons edaphi]MDM7830632.1 phosphate ABC transporter substrate-binding protein PstS [Cellulomons edaphi]
MRRALALLVLAGSLLATGAAPAAADSFVPVNGAGSSWSSNAVDQWRRNVEQYGMRINYASTGSSDGRNQFKAGTVDFAITEIPYGLKDGGVVDTPPSRGFVYMPIVAGGTAFMYNLSVGGKQVTNLRLSGEVVTGIFTGTITSWDDAAIAKDNPGLALPRRKIVPVVRSDGSGSTAQFTTWMAARHQSAWDAYCKAAGRSTPCGVTSSYPTIPGKGFVAQPNSQGVAGYVAQRGNVGTITYVEYSYALKTGYPVAKVLNEAGYYVEPTASNVAVGLLGARINTDESSPKYLTQDLSGVYTNKDKRTYPLSSYSYIVVPTSAQNGFTAPKGHTLGAFASYFLCEGQQQAEVLGYSPLPINLVQAGLDQVGKIPGATDANVDIKKCHNPTFSADGSNTLTKNAPQPSECDKQGNDQCDKPTGGAAPAPGKGSTPSGAGAEPSTPAKGTTSTGGTGTAGTGDDPGTDGGAVTGPTGTDGGGDAGTAGGGGGGAVVAGATTGGGPVVCSDDTGECTNLVSMPVETDAPQSGGVGPLAVVAACLLAVGLVVIPPLVSRGAAARKARR